MANIPAVQFKKNLESVPFVHWAERMASYVETNKLTLMIGSITTLTNIDTICDTGC